MSGLSGGGITPAFKNEFTHSPPPGLNPDEFDSLGQFARIAEGSNEVTKKLQLLIAYLSLFKERKLVDSNGKIYKILVQEQGSTDVAAVAAGQHWVLSVAFVDPDWRWSVSSVGSTVQDGTNGSLIALSGGAEPPWKTGAIKFNVSDATTNVSSTVWISLKVEVDPTFLTLTNWELVAEGSEPDEVEFDTINPPYGQIFARLKIGKITWTPASPPLLASASVTEQYANDHQRIVRLFLNGKPAKGFSDI